MDRRLTKIDRRGDTLKLTLYTDYSIQVLMYLGTLPSGRLATMREIASTFDISYNHLMKIIQTLSKEGIIVTYRGRNGGLVLAEEPHEIRIGQLVRTLENLDLGECYKEGGGHCILAESCMLKQILDKALSSFLSVLDEHTLQDLIQNKTSLRELFNIPID